MLMGLLSAPSSFQYVISNLFANMEKFVKVYIGDTIIYSASTEEH